MTTKAELKQLLLELLGAEGDQKLGFGDAPGSSGRLVFVNRQYPDCLWYEWDSEARKHIPIEESAITGTLREIGFRDAEFRNKAATKIQFKFNCGEQGLISLESAVSTVFAKVVLLTLSQIPKADLSGVITLAVKKGTTDAVILPEVYVKGQRVSVEYPENFKRSDFDIYSLIDAVATAINGPQQTDEAEDF